MQSPCALYVPHYTVQALRARGKRTISRLTSRFRVASYCRRVDLVCECDKHGIGGGGKHCDDNDAQPDASAAETSGKHCDDNDAQPDASAAETSTAATTMHSPTAFHTARPHQHLGRQEAAAYATRGGRGLRYALARSGLRCRGVYYN